jgi:hypothetical protein
VLEVELFTRDGSELVLQPLLDAGLLTLEKEEPWASWYSFMYLFVAEDFFYICSHSFVIEISFLCPKLKTGSYKYKYYPHLLYCSSKTFVRNSIT